MHGSGRTQGSPLRNMKNKIDFHGRRSIRLKGWDHATPNYSFITLCSQNRECLFGEIANGEMTLNAAGKMLNKEWRKLPTEFDFLELDECIIMPNHVHAILHIIRRGEPWVRPRYCIRPGPCICPKSAIHSEAQDDQKDRLYGTESRSIGRIVQAYKSITTHQYIQQIVFSQRPEFQKRLWQRNYYEHIIRNENELKQIREYIQNNPAGWQNDGANPHASFM
jgi:putative transposase